MNSKILQIQATFTSDTGRVGLKYVVDNLSGSDVYLLDMPYHIVNEEPTGQSILGYSILEDGRLTLLRGLLRVPNGMQVEMPDVPYARLLRAGQRADASAESSLPVAYNNPYDWTDHEIEHRSTRVRLRIGYLFTNQLGRQPDPVQIDGKSAYRLIYREALGAQQFAETPYQDIAITLIQKP